MVRNELVADATLRALGLGAIRLEFLGVEVAQYKARYRTGFDVRPALGSGAAASAD
jgi:hypothetical protein